MQPEQAINMIINNMPMLLNTGESIDYTDLGEDYAQLVREVIEAAICTGIEEYLRNG